MTPDDTVTITTPDGSDFVTLDDCMADNITVGNSIKLGGYADEISGDTLDTYTYITKDLKWDDLQSVQQWDDLFTTPEVVKVGDKELTADMVEKLGALLDMIEGLDDDNALKQLFDTQLGMNKIRGDNET